MSRNRAPTPDDLAQGHAQRRPIQLGGAAMKIGHLGSPPVELGQQQPGAPQRSNAETARAYGRAEALAQPIQVQSGTVAEALAEMLAGGLRGRAAYAERERELNDQTREQKVDEGRRTALAEALADFDPSNPQASIERMRQGAPEEAFDLATLLARQHTQQDPALPPEVEEYISTLPPDQQALARLNPQAFVSGMMRHRYPAPSQGRQSYDVPDDLEPF